MTVQNVIRSRSGYSLLVYLRVAERSKVMFSTTSKWCLPFGIPFVEYKRSTGGEGVYGRRVAKERFSF